MQQIQYMDILVIPNHNKDNDDDTNNITTTQYQIVMDGDEHLAHYWYWKYHWKFHYTKLILMIILFVYLLVQIKKRYY